MKIMVTAEGPNLEAPLAPNFARCQCFLLVSIETMEFEAIANPALAAPGGVGIAAAQLATDKGADAVLTQLIGPNAFAALESAGVPVFSAPQGSVRSAIQALRAAHLIPLEKANAEAHRAFPRGAEVQDGARQRVRSKGSKPAAAEPRSTEPADLEALRAEVQTLRQSLIEAESKILELRGQKKQEIAPAERDPVDGPTRSHEPPPPANQNRA
jgi:predicted Fe-Mo cluster-binding NifX family protein